MHGNGVGMAASNLNPASTQLNKTVNPSVSGTHQAALRQLQDCVMLADALLAKVRGGSPDENSKAPEEMPSVMANAAKINVLACGVAGRLKELLDIIGD